jgi:hypothetical protein
MADKISAVIITYNEAQNILRCINSLLPVVDEIIVVDSFSADGTKAICETASVVFVQTKWLGYGATKNYGHSIASNNYILSIDADEALSNELAKEIILQKQQLKNCYSFNRLTNYAGTWVKHGGWYPDTKTRLFNKETIAWNLAPVHEQLVLPANQTIIKLKGDLLHYSFTSTTQHKQKIQKYAPLEGSKVMYLPAHILYLKLLFSPISIFVKKYLVQLGFIDGLVGWHVARLSAYATFMRYSCAIQAKAKQV